jgi:hypothetical protein
VTWDNVIALADLQIQNSSLLDSETWVSTTLDNYAQTFYAGVRIDLGHWTPNNVNISFPRPSPCTDLLQSDFHKLHFSERCFGLNERCQQPGSGNPLKSRSLRLPQLHHRYCTFPGRTNTTIGYSNAIYLQHAAAQIFGKFVLKRDGGDSQHVLVRTCHCHNATARLFFLAQVGVGLDDRGYGYSRSTF